MSPLPQTKLLDSINRYRLARDRPRGAAGTPVLPPTAMDQAAYMPPQHLGGAAPGMVPGGPDPDGPTLSLV